MLIVDSSLDIINRSMRHPLAIQDCQPLLGSFGLRHVLNHAFEQISILDSQRICQESLVSGPFRFSEGLAHDEEEPIITATNHEIAIGCLEASVGDDGC